MTSHETGFKTCFGIIQHSFKTCFGIIQHQLVEEKKGYKLEVISTVSYHTSNLRKCMEVNGEALQLCAVYKKPYFNTASCVRICISIQLT